MFSENLIRLRTNEGITQDDMAKSMKLSRSVIAKWESGRGLPNTKNLIELSKRFNVSIETLIQ